MSTSSVRREDLGKTQKESDEINEERVVRRSGNFHRQGIRRKREVKRNVRGWKGFVRIDEVPRSLQYRNRFWWCEFSVGP